MSKKAETGYKVVNKMGWMISKRGKRALRKVLMSCVRNSVYMQGVQYRVGQYVEPNEGCGPLCVFEDLYSAVMFADQAGRDCMYIYKCRYIRSDTKTVWTNQSAAPKIDGRNVYCLSGITVHLDHLPKGTVLAEKVKLLRRITI